MQGPCQNCKHLYFQQLTCGTVIAGPAIAMPKVKVLITKDLAEKAVTITVTFGPKISDKKCHG